ncbi:hypothetical protein AA12717_3032 [Gluconacetobacter sacchari DSM 12717]|uniref:Uncharacterized protein n=1 Tax=Gluconacetobacter sacchari DSM 12717 TaxID=1307940 RepID=A0ABQ0PAB5_9PROT|nr:hypothetical protein AA12717_3032 [Gluconacetobacter sacchari DSM 12717]
MRFAFKAETSMERVALSSYRFTLWLTTKLRVFLNFLSQDDRFRNRQGAFE